MDSQIYPLELQLNKANTIETQASFSDLHLSVPNDTVSTKIYHKCDIFYFKSVNVPFLDSDVLHLTEFIILIASNLLEPLDMLQTSTLAIYL